jgi:hypothetical protein
MARIYAKNGPPLRQNATIVTSLIRRGVPWVDVERTLSTDGRRTTLDAGRTIDDGIGWLVGCPAFQPLIYVKFVYVNLQSLLYNVGFPTFRVQ